MIDLADNLRGQAESGARAYDAVPVPQGYTEAFTRGVRGVRLRRRAAGTIASLALVAAVGVGLASIMPSEAEPANPVPGTVVWSAQLGAESWSSPGLVGDATVVVAADDGVVRGLDLTTGAESWRVETGGDIRSAVVVEEDKAFVASEDGRVYAIDEAGAVLWSVEVYDPIASHEVWTPYSAAPVVANGRVYIGDRRGVVHALDAATGSPLWTARIGGAIATQAATDGDVLVVGGRDATLYAFDAQTGVERWSAALDGEITSSPAVADGVVVSGSRGTYVVGFDADTGTELWRVPLGTSWAEASPVIADGVAYFGSSNAGDVTSVDVQSGEVAWRAHVGGMPWARPAVDGDTVFATAVSTSTQKPWNGALFAIDRATGEVLWWVPGGVARAWSPDGEGYGAGTEPLVTPRVVVVAGLDGVVYAVSR